ncbi:MAG: glycosyltransferase family 2 protein [Thermodesulfobacteriota bacterium]|jgi:glycosyltransferase involved in cell wall biosynthesis
MSFVADLRHRQSEAVADVSKMPRITVITPSYNQGQFLEATIQSVVFQAYPNLEYIIIDGGSQDESVQVIRKYEKHLAYWHSKRDKGQADAINQGMGLATGEILCWINSDDMYLPGTFLEVGKRFNGKTDEPYFIYGSALTMEENGQNLQGGARLAGIFDQERLTYSDYIVQPSTFWTKRLWLEVGGLNVEYHYVLDWEWFIRASRVTGFECVPRFFSIYRLHAEHKTGTGGSKRIGEINEVVERYAPESWKRLYKLVFPRYQRIIQIRRLITRMKIPGSSYLLPLFFPRIVREGGAKSRDQLMTILYMYGLDPS